MIGYGYDPLNRVTLKLMPAPHDSVRYAYDLRGLQTGAAFASTGWGVSNAYDGFGRLISTASNMGGPLRTVSHQYDREGRESEITYPDNQKFWTARDGLGRATEMYQAPLGSTSTIMVAFAYNAASQLSYFARRFGDMTAYGYDGAGRLSSLEDGFGAGLGNTRSDFLYNPASQLRSETRTNDSYAWRGSAAVSRDYATNGQNQYSGTSSGATFDYDTNGNLTSTINAPWSTSYVYDPENRLISASGTDNAQLIYDPLGRLFQISSPATGTTQFLYDGDELVAEYNGSGTLLRRYVHGDGVDDPLFWYEGSGMDQPRFSHTDRHGSVTGTAGPGAMLLGINTYDEYGIRGANNAGRFQYTGQAWLAELGLYYYKARLYSPTLGRFLQVDPVGYDDQINLYAYVKSDPINKGDPTGNETHYYRPDGSIVVVQTYQVDRTASPVASNATIEASVASRLSGTSSAGNRVTVVMVNSSRENPVHYVGDPTRNSTSPDPARRSQTAIDGRTAKIAPNATPDTIPHETGHALGINDHYHDVTDAAGKVLGTQADAGHGNTIMGDKRGPANAVQIDEMLKSANRVVHCAGPPSGGCNPK